MTVFKCQVVEREDPSGAAAERVYMFPEQPQRGDFVRVLEPPMSGTVVGFSYFGHLTSPDGPTPLMTPPIMWISAEVKPDYLGRLEKVASETPSS